MKKLQSNAKEGDVESYNEKLMNSVSYTKNMFIIKLIFEQNKNFTIQNKAIQLLIDSLSQRKTFWDEIVKVELIVSENEDLSNKNDTNTTDTVYHQYKNHYSRLK